MTWFSGYLTVTTLLVLSDPHQLISTSPSPNWSGHCFDNQHQQFTVQPGTGALEMSQVISNPKLKIAEMQRLELLKMGRTAKKPYALS